MASPGWPQEGASRSGRWPGVGQGEALTTWLLWALLLVAMGVTYSRIDPSRLYADVSRHGIAGGLSRVAVASNFPVSLVAIALVLVALDALPVRAWWLGTPAIVLCAVTAWPGVVDQSDLDARPVNAVPAVGVALALALTATAAARTGRGIAPRRSLDGVRVAVAVGVLLVAIPYIAAEIGVYLPDGIFLMQRRLAEPDGTLAPAVHLGHHHGFDGALLVVSALLLSRPRLRRNRLATVTLLYVSLVFAYGLVNLIQDSWHEQVVKRGWVHWQIPSALLPRLTPIWLVVLAIAAATAFALRHELLRDRQAAEDGSEPLSRRREGRREHDPGGSLPAR